MNVARGLHVATLASLTAFGWWTAELGVYYWVGFVLVAVLLLAEHLLVLRRDISAVLAGFFRTNAAVGVVLLGAVLLDLLRTP
jgi:4-hydroxybenzoate polyprenyltransferase